MTPQNNKTIPLTRDYSQDLVKIMKKRISYTDESGTKIEKTVKELVTIITELFCVKGSPISTSEITSKLGLEKAGKFQEKVLTKHMKLPNSKEEAEKQHGDFAARSDDVSEKKEKKKDQELFCREERKNKSKTRYYWYPAGFILRHSTTPIDFTKYLTENLDKISNKICINICKPEIILSEYIKQDFEHDSNNLVVQCLLDVVSKRSSPIPQNRLSKAIKERFLTPNLEVKPFVFGNLNLNFILWHGTGEIEFTHEDILCEYNDNKSELPEELENIKARIVTEQENKAREQGKVFDNNETYKLLKITTYRKVIPEAKTRKLGFKLTLGPTDFYTAVATNHSLDRQLKNESGSAFTIREEYRNDFDGWPTYLKNSPLANPVGVAIVCVTKDNKILLQERSKQVFFGSVNISLTAENMIRGTDEDKNGTPSLFLTVKRCLKEEIGIEIDIHDIKFLGFGVRLDTLYLQGLALVHLDKTSDELKSHTLARDRWEGNNFTHEFTVESLKGYILSEQTMSDTAKLTILLALINKYGHDYVKEHLIVES